MSTLLEDLRKYFRETPREKIMSDWALSEEFDKVGPQIDEFIEISKKYYTLECYDINTIVSGVQINKINNNPKFTTSGSFL